MTRDEEIRAVAVQAAASCWAGLTSMRGGRSANVIKDAKEIEEYIRGEDEVIVDDDG